MMELIGVGVGAFKAVTEGVKALKDMDSAADRNSAVIALQQQILDLQLATMDLIETNRRLNREVNENEAWKQEASRYELKDFGGETFAYALKQDSSKSEPHHLLCPTCFQQHKKSILHGTGNYQGQRGYDCLSCKHSLFLGHYSPQPSSVQAPDW